MTDNISIDASKARNNFFNILNTVYKDKTVSFTIKKSGIPVAVISKYKATVSKKTLNFAGAWKGIKQGKRPDNLLKEIYEARKDTGKVKRKLPSF
ncbi:MAG: hypothetical protein PVJ09_04380 [Candidatus Woesebacteria bacterium]|jgi:hypothetical protein